MQLPLLLSLSLFVCLSLSLSLSRTSVRRKLTAKRTETNLTEQGKPGKENYYDYYVHGLCIYERERARDKERERERAAM